MEGVLNNHYGQAYIDKMRAEHTLYTQRARQARIDKRKIPNPTKASVMRDEYLKNVKRSGASSGMDNEQVNNILVRMKKSKASLYKDATRRQNVNRSVDAGALPNIRRGNIDALLKSEK